MKGTTLGQIKPGSSFWFGGVRFLKYKNTEDEMVPCQIYGTGLTVHIAKCAWVFKPNVHIVFKDGIFLLKDIILPLTKYFR